MTKTFLVVYAKVPGKNFAGQAPDVPGCVSAGDTLEEMRVMMREGLESHFQVMTEYGERLPEPATTSVDFKDDDFEDVEYFVVEHLQVEMPVQHHKGEAISA
ncbi:putative RNase H-like HicB family nuclease [Silvibacterium bohemicum]|uniref:Putative RNase H-like HicB family nuclease n=1 Tax=Silvibacterium bohemicum TaxID=1577686 RepID=A0A841K239_9BACT|nr:type II toxin-antitoxin system HicB family antitoxin [Silvibacterium bohemicum]MBB6146657.1 putative RNase H-like HicB family nuclease [Silvibacterium bohemicum]